MSGRQRNTAPKQDVGDIRTEFIEKVGVIAQNDGLPRAAGRIMGLLIFDGQAVSFAGLAEQLQISRGSVSSATRILLDRALIRRVARPGDRQDYFTLSSTPYASMLGAVKSGIERAHEDIFATLERLPADHADTRRRIGDYAGLYAALSTALDDAIRKMTAQDRARDTPDGSGVNES